MEAASMLKREKKKLISETILSILGGGWLVTVC